MDSRTNWSAFVTRNPPDKQQNGRDNDHATPPDPISLVQSNSTTKCTAATGVVDSVNKHVEDDKADAINNKLGETIVTW